MRLLQSWRDGRSAQMASNLLKSVHQLVSWFSLLCSDWRAAASLHAWPCRMPHTKDHLHITFNVGGEIELCGRQVPKRSLVPAVDVHKFDDSLNGVHPKIALLLSEVCRQPEEEDVAKEAVKQETPGADSAPVKLEPVHACDNAPVQEQEQHVSPDAEVVLVDSQPCIRDMLDLQKLVSPPRHKSVTLLELRRHMKYVKQHKECGAPPCCVNAAFGSIPLAWPHVGRDSREHVPMASRRSKYMHVYVVYHEWLHATCMPEAVQQHLTDSGNVQCSGALGKNDRAPSDGTAAASSSGHCFKVSRWPAHQLRSNTRVTGMPA